MNRQKDNDSPMTALLSRFSSVTGMVVSTIAAALALFVAALPSFFAADDEPRPRFPPTGSSNAELEQMVLSLSREVQAVKKELEGLTAVPEDAVFAAHLSRLEQTLSATNERLASLEDAILVDPGKALQLPLLTNEVADLAERTEAAIAAQRNDLDRVYDILKFSIGALAVGVLSMAITTVFRSRHEPPS